MTDSTNLSPSDILKIGFKISNEGDKINDNMMKLLGSEFRYGPARLAIAFAISEGKLKKFTGPSSSRIIRGENLFGAAEDIHCWTILLKTAFPDAELSSTRGYQEIVNSLWDAGIKSLNELWRETGENRAEFIKHLAENAGLDTSGNRGPEIKPVDEVVRPPKIHPADKVAITLGGISQNIKTGEKVTWEVNKDGNAPVLAFMGTMGTGKTETAFQVIEQIKQQSNASFLIFDVKGDLSDSKRQLQTGAKVINCFEEAVPVDAFTPLGKSENQINTAAQEFRDTFVQVPKSNIGPNQQRNCLEAAKLAMRSSSTVTLHSIKRALDDLYEEEDLKRDSLQNTLGELCDFDYFTPKMTLDEFFSQSWIIDIHDVPETAQRLIPFFILDALWNWYAKQRDSEKSGQFRALRNVLVIDEARELLARGQRSLVNIVRQSRSKGGVTVFMSQSPDDYDSGNEDFLTNVGLTVAFRTNARPTSLKRVLGDSVDLSGLETGQCYTRLSNDTKKPIKVKVWGD